MRHRQSAQVLFQISFGHEYYDLGGTPDLIRIKPDDETARTLGKANCVFRLSANQITVYGLGDSSTLDLIAAPLQFYFWELDAAFCSYTDMPGQSDRCKLLYTDKKTVQVQEDGQILQTLQLSEPDGKDEVIPVHNQPLGIIQLDPSNPALPEDRRLISASGNLQPQHYTIWFPALKSIWRYILVGLEDQAAHITTVEGKDFSTPQAMQLNGRSALEIRSLVQIKVGYKADRPTLHYANSDGKAVAMQLPVPATCTSNKTGAEPVSDICVYI